jgi:hypothetical protein
LLGNIVSHPTPLHPDADLALVLDELRQSVAASGDEGLILRVFVAGIRLALLSILDTLIGLLADFRAGRLPPVLEAEWETRHERTAPPPSPDDRTAASKQGAASRPAHTSRTTDPRATSAGAPEQNATEHADAAPRRSGSPLAAPPPPVRHPGHGPRATAFRPSHVRRWSEIEAGKAFPTHAQIVTI